MASGPCPRRHRRFQLPACLAPRRARPRPLGRFPLARRQVSVSQVALDSRVALDSQVALDSRVALGSRVALDSRAALVANHRRPLLCRRTCLERRQRARRPSWEPRAKLRLRRRLGQFKECSSSRCLERLAAGPDRRRRCSEPEPRVRGSAARRSQEFPRRCGPLGSNRGSGSGRLEPSTHRRLDSVPALPSPPPPVCKVDVDTLDIKDDIVRAFWELTYVPVGCTGPLSPVRTCCGRSRPGKSRRIRMWLVSQ